MKLFIFLMLFFTYSQPLFADYVFEEHSTRRLDQSSINYYLQKPNDGSKFSILIVMQGSDCNSVYPSASNTSGSLSKIGLARLDVEKYGLSKDSKNCPKEYLSHNTIDQRVMDYLRVIQILRATEPNWNHKILIVGGSEGAVIAPIVASFTPETIKLVLMASGGGLTMREDLLLLEEQKLAKAGKSKTFITHALKKMTRKMDQIISRPEFNKNWLGKTNTYKWWASILDVLPLQFLVDLNFPIYVVHGSADTAASVEGSRRTVTKFKELGKTNLTYVEYPDLDHHWNDSKGESHAKEVLNGVFAWLLRP